MDLDLDLDSTLPDLRLGLDTSGLELELDFQGIFTRSPYNGERGNVIVMYGCVCVCVCHEVSQTRCGRTLRRTAFVLGSFERSIPLV